LVNTTNPAPTPGAAGTTSPSTGITHPEKISLNVLRDPVTGVFESLLLSGGWIKVGVDLERWRVREKGGQRRTSLPDSGQRNNGAEDNRNSCSLN
jgi:hypothetical protein